MSNSIQRVASRWMHGAVINRNHPETLAWVQGFFKRHPKLKPFLKDDVIHVSEPGSGSHPEARFDHTGIRIYPKFWAHKRDVQDFIFAHELGHSVESNNLSLNRLLPTVAEEYGVDVWDNLPFGQYNMGEAFADSFASYFIDKEVFQRYPEWARLVEAVAYGR